MNMYTKFENLNLDTSCIGLDRSCLDNDDIKYFCTPVGARIIGWEGCDGIHYCFIEKFKDMVFAVNPMSCCDYYVYPLAENFTDFLRLILAVHGAATIEQIILWNKATFERIIRSESHQAHASYPEVQEVLEVLHNEFHLAPMEEPFEYVKKIQSSFDYSKIPFSEEYYDIM